MEHQHWELQTLYIAKALQLNHSVVIAMSSNHPPIEETKGPLSSPELPLTPKHYFSYHKSLLSVALSLVLLCESPIFWLNHNPLDGIV